MPCLLLLSSSAFIFSSGLRNEIFGYDELEIRKGVDRSMYQEDAGAGSAWIKFKLPIPPAASWIDLNSEELHDGAEMAPRFRRRRWCPLNSWQVLDDSLLCIKASYL